MNNIDYRYLRPKKAASLKNMYDCGFEFRNHLEVWRGQNATILPLKEIPGDHILFGRGGVVDANEDYVPLSALGQNIRLSYPVSNPDYKDETVVFCGYLVKHWGHFLVEAITRLWYFLEQDPSVDKYVFFLKEGEEREISGNYKEFFQLLGVWDKLEIISKPTKYREVIVPEMSFLKLSYYSQQHLNMLDTVAHNITVDPSWTPLDKIFFTRSNFAKDNGYEFGLDFIDHFYEKNGYAVLAPEILPLSQTIYYIRNASEIASISGSTPHNMLFARTGQGLTMVERLVMNDDFQISINLIRQLDVTHLDANFHLYSVDWCGPYILGCNHILEQYVQDKNMCMPDEYYASAKYRDLCIKQYMRSYQDNYRYRWFMEDWYPTISDTIWEAYQDSYPYFQDYLDGNKPFLREHYYQWHYVKQFIKRLIRRR